METNRQPGPRKTLFTAMMVLVLLVVALTGLVYSVHLLMTLPAKP